MLNKDDLIKLINKINDCEYSSEEEAEADLEVLRDNVIDPNAEDYIFQIEYDGLSAEEIADKILSYKPIILGGPSNT